MPSPFAQPDDPDVENVELEWRLLHRGQTYARRLVLRREDFCSAEALIHKMADGAIAVLRQFPEEFPEMCGVLVDCRTDQAAAASESPA